MANSETVRYLETERGILVHKDDILSMIRMHIGAYRKLEDAAGAYPDSPIYNASRGSWVALAELLKDVESIGGKCINE